MQALPSAILYSAAKYWVLPIARQFTLTYSSVRSRRPTRFLRGNQEWDWTIWILPTASCVPCTRAPNPAHSIPEVMQEQGLARECFLAFPSIRFSPPCSRQRKPETTPLANPRPLGWRESPDICKAVS